MDTTTFFHSLFADYPAEMREDSRLEIRCLAPIWDADRPRPYPRQWYTLDTQYLHNAALFCEEFAQEWDVYFGVLPRRGRSGSQQDVYAASSLFCDVDGGTDSVQGAIERLYYAGIPLPHITIKSGGGVHCYFHLAEPIPLPDHTARERFKKVLRCLCKAIGGASPAAHADLSACEVARVLRVPGTFNHKRQNEPRPVEVLRLNGNEPRLTFEQWICLLPKEPVQKWESEPVRRPHTNAGFISEGLLNWARTGYPEGNRHKDLTGAAAWLVRTCGVSKSDALMLMELKAAASPGARRVTRQELEGIVKWA